MNFAPKIHLSSLSQRSLPVPHQSISLFASLKGAVNEPIFEGATHSHNQKLLDLMDDPKNHEQLFDDAMDCEDPSIIKLKGEEKGSNFFLWNQLKKVPKLFKNI